MNTVSFTIDSRPVTVPEGTTVLEAALRNDIYIPHLCHHPDVEARGACRLCIVETGRGQLIAACRTPVEAGMTVATRSPAVDRVVRPVLDLIVANNHTSCRGCRATGRCDLQRIIAHFRIDRKRLQRFRPPRAEMPVDTSNPFFDYDPNRCVLCGVCVQTCESIQGASAIDFTGKGITTRVAPFAGKPLAESRCESCGECVVRCPVGALVFKSTVRPAIEVRSVCPYCSVGCGVHLGVREGTVVSVRGDESSPASRGQLCVRGRFGWSFVHSRERLTSPLVKREGRFVEVTWDEALDLVAARFARFKGDRFAMIASTRCTNEESYLAQKFARSVMRSNNIDSNVRLSQAPLLVALGRATNTGVTTNAFGDLGKAATILAVGTDLTQRRPVIGSLVRKAARRGAQLIVIHPQRIDLCELADIWLRPRPGTEVALLVGLCRVIIGESLADTVFVKHSTEGFAAFEKASSGFGLEQVQAITGVDASLIQKAARAYATGKPASVIFAEHVACTSHPAGAIIAMTNLALLTGNTGAGAGIYSMWDDNNSQGSSDMGCLPGYFPGYQEVGDPEARRRLEEAWGVNLNPEPGLAVTQLEQAVRDRRVESLYIIGSDVLTDASGLQRTRQALQAVEFLVVQDLFLTEAARLADVVLPAASFAEKDGTFTNAERRVQRVRKAIEPVGSARPDWQIFAELGCRLGSTGFAFQSPAEIMMEIASVAPIYAGISYDRLERDSPQWQDPVPEGSRGRARFMPLDLSGHGITSAEYPLLLHTRSGLYHQGTLSTRVEGLNLLNGREVIEINAGDAVDAGATDGKMVRVISQFGETRVTARVTGATPVGLVILRTHRAGTGDVLFNSVSDSRTCAVRIVPVKDSPDASG